MLAVRDFLYRNAAILLCGAPAILLCGTPAVLLSVVFEDSKEEYKLLWKWADNIFCQSGLQERETETEGGPSKPTFFVETADD